MMHAAWNAFNGRSNEDAMGEYASFGSGMNLRQDRRRGGVMNDRSIISSIYTRIGVDVASVYFRHIRKDQNGRYLEMMKSGLNECLNVEANLDQAGTAFRLDMVMSLFDKGFIAIVPVETSINPDDSAGYDIRQLRVGEIVHWYPEHVRVSVYNEKTGRREELVLSKRLVAIVENPLYSVMNEPNSILQRIIRKLQLLDAVDEAAGSGKLDLIIQLPYTIKSESKRAQAEKRRDEIETQLKGSKYGLAYADGLEKIVQLNRPAENNMLKQIEYLMTQLFGQLGLAESIFNGTADEATMLNYHNRTVEPFLRAFAEAMSRRFISKTARTQGQTIDYLRDPFKLAPISQLADIGEKFARNEVLTANEIRALIGFMPNNDPKADQLVNSNMPQADRGGEPQEGAPAGGTPDMGAEQDALMEQTFAALEASADEIVKNAGG